MAFGKKKNPKPTQEERILDTKIQLRELKRKYEGMLRVQRRVLQNSATPREKELAEAKIRSGLCAYTICTQAQNDLDEITSDMELNRSLKTLNRSLKVINRLGRKSGAGPITKASLNRRVNTMKKREDSVTPEDIFSDDTLAAVDEWLGSRWEGVASKFISGADLKDCLNETRSMLEDDPMPFMDDDVFGSGGTGNSIDDDGLKDLLSSDIF